VNLSLDRLEGHLEIHERPAQDGGDRAIVKAPALEPTTVAKEETVVAKS